MESSAAKKRVSRSVSRVSVSKKRTTQSHTKTSAPRAKRLDGKTIVANVPQSRDKKSQAIPIKNKHTRGHASLKISNRSNAEKKHAALLTNSEPKQVPKLSAVLQPTFLYEHFTAYTLPQVPVPSRLVMVRVTRVFGMLFFLVGALGMYTYVQNFSNTLVGTSMVGQLSTPMMSQRIQESQPQVEATILDAGSVKMFEQTERVAPGAVDALDSASETSMAQARIAVDNRVDSSEEMILTITVPHATKVTVLTYIKKNRSVVSLGDATQLDNTTWRYEWNTRDFPESEYTFKLSVRSTQVQHQFTDSKTYTIQRNDASATKKHSNNGEVDAQIFAQSAESQSSTETELTDATSSEDTFAQPPSFIFKSVDGSTFKSQKTLSVTGPGSDAVVKLYAYNDATTNQYYLGKPYYSGVNEWSVSWDTTRVPDGDYTLQGDAKDGNVRHSFAPVKVRINNLKHTSSLSGDTAASGTLQESVPVLKPDVLTRIDGNQKLEGFKEIFFEAPGVDRIEVYALPKNSLTPLFLGQARYDQGTRWKFFWNTKETPNGEYTLYPKAKNQYGFFDGEKILVTVLNTQIPALSETQSRSLESLHTAIDALQPIFDDTEDATSSTSTAMRDGVLPPDAFASEIILDTTRKLEFRNFVTEYNDTLNDKLILLSKASRQGDDATYNTVLQDIEKIKNEFSEKISDRDVYDDVTDATQEYITKLTDRSIETTVRNEKILKERIGDAIVQDSDADGISDYDELHLYQTNPFAADSDGDGFLDNTEIVQGFDPLNIEREALIVYESPKESGIIRDDILAVSSIATLEETTEEVSDVLESTRAPKAVISGKGLPNSFVTLYIFSEPIVVTVKTDSSGNWNYVFDKELEDGSHEVYVGITDNAGRVIAKSEPLAFVKTAEAFTGGEITDTMTPSIVDRENLWSDETLILIGSGVVLGIGLILMLLGLYVGVRKEPELIAAA